MLIYIILFQVVMEGSEGSPPPSMCMIRAAELFPKQPTEKEDNQIIVNFQEREYNQFIK